MFSPSISPSPMYSYLFGGMSLYICSSLLIFPAPSLFSNISSSLSPHVLFEFISFPLLISILISFYHSLSLYSPLSLSISLSLFLSLFLVFILLSSSHSLQFSNCLYLSLSLFCPFLSLSVSRSPTQSTKILLSLTSSQSLSLFFQLSFSLSFSQHAPISMLLFLNSSRSLPPLYSCILCLFSMLLFLYSCLFL